MLLLFRLAVGARIPDLLSDTLVAPPYCTPGDGATAGDCGPPAIVSWVFFLVFTVLNKFFLIPLIAGTVRPRPPPRPAPPREAGEPPTLRGGGRGGRALARPAAGRQAGWSEAGPVWN
jgi:hypothetical protein